MGHKHVAGAVQIADRVLVLEEGRIVEDFPPAELIGETTDTTPRRTKRGFSRSRGRGALTRCPPTG